MGEQPGLGPEDEVAGAEIVGVQATSAPITDDDYAVQQAINLDASLADVAPQRSLAADAWRRFRRNKLALFGLGLVLVLILLAVFGPLFVASPTYTNPTNFDSPSGAHWLGTDDVGRDVLARIVYGIRLSLFIGFVATMAETFIGIVIGALAGWFRGWIDTVLMRIVDIMLGVPYLVLALVLVSVLHPGVPAVIITLAATAWLQTARTVRAGFLQVRDLEYVEAAQATGVSTFRIIWRHIMPNVLQPVVVLMAVGVGAAILAEAALSFLGAGIHEPQASLGLMINKGQFFVTTHPMLLIAPGVTIVLCVLGFLLIGDGLRDALDVKDT
jgi:peptide/nickel transport system permease protein